MTLTSSRIYNLFYEIPQVNLFPMTAEDYTEAINWLHERYGNTQVHVKQLVSLPALKSIKDVSGLRNLIEKLEVSVRNLKSLKVDPNSQNILLVPLVN